MSALGCTGYGQAFASTLGRGRVDKRNGRHREAGLLLVVSSARHSRSDRNGSIVLAYCCVRVVMAEIREEETKNSLETP